MDEVICGVQVIKMYAWELPFSKLIKLSRKFELKMIRKNAYVRALYMTFLLFTNRMGVFCTMLSIVLMYGQDHMTAAKIFVISAYFSIISQSISQSFARAIAEIAEALVSLRRLQSFMEYDEKNSKSTTFLKQGISGEYFKKTSVLEIDKHLPGHIAISIKNATARWIPNEKVTESNRGNDPNEIINDMDSKSATLNNISIDLNKGNLIGVIGSVGAGKSSLLLALLRELPLETGSISLSGTISYASQLPWIFPASIRQNILFGEKVNRSRFNAVIQACALTKDFKNMEDGENTIIGDRGVNLSGGQKARISLARAIYREADIYLFDDPLSAVDAHVGRHLFNNCIGQNAQLAAQGATRILVTHQIQFLKNADLIIVLRDGKIEAQGSPNDLLSSRMDIAHLLGTHELDDSKSVAPHSRSPSLILTNEDVLNELIENVRSAEKLQKLEASSAGKAKKSVVFTYLQTGGNYFVIFALFVLFFLTQGFASAADFWVSYWTSQEELREYYHRQNLTNYGYNDTITQTILQEDLRNDTDLWTIYADGTNLQSTTTCICIHASFVSLVFIVGILRSLAFYEFSIRASQKLHDSMFKGIISTSMRFFDTNPSGRILNRFSKDMGAIDEMLPKAVMDASQFLLNMVGVVVLTATVNPLFLVPVGVLATIFVIIRQAYLKTSKNLKRLEGICRSPVYTHISSSLDGLETIRAFGVQNALIDEFDNHQDLHSSCFYMCFTTNFAFGLSLDILCTIFICIVTSSFLLYEYDQNVMGNKVGLAISQIMVLTGTLQWGIRQSAEVANHMMSTERILEYSNLESEIAPSEPLKVSKTWPQQGKIEFEHVVYRYFAEADPVLRNICIVIKPKEKIGIVGRTGAGKSSLIGALFRLGNIEGNIIIDNVDTASISLKELRSKISIIPQDPVLFSGTMRKNLDPFEEYTDNDIWRVLEEVEMKHFAIDSLGLQTIVMAGGSNFSVGQRQLLCLARALLRNNKILLLDEATANVDPHTDDLIQQTIRKKFDQCTVLTVAHRLHTIMDSDRILVMDAGKMVQFAAPHELLYRSKGIFREMVFSLGVKEADRLSRIAEEKFKSKHKML